MNQPTQIVSLVFLAACLGGCGTTRWSDTPRTATEQRLISNAIDESVNSIDVSPLAHQKVFFDTSNIDDSVQQKYLISSLKYHLLRNGCYVLEKKEEADYVVEARAGVIGTDHHDLLIGIPESSLGAGIPGMPASLPEMALYKKTNQLGEAKIGLFAYHRTDGNLVWSSDTKISNKLAKSVWAMGIGPMQRDGTDGPIRWAGEAPPQLPKLAMPALSVPQFARKDKPETPEYEMPELAPPPSELDSGKVSIQPAGNEIPVLK
ncbi:hypothetical protein Pan258_43370 [Symmachiella dynata]|uniref:Uncharacterized protein n=1 Tax=Symmachiella dynata TaxID=2527995 RepID=A0A517ZU40_9PLAN|nr:DUF6655 family protein [Symmachiella dynata]QDT50280.1 hypothetical protein Pan258_43370 [Symmachiella dynata]QDU46003.1 hypothetical protein Mal52_45000 [Symmachiella dynata]